MVVLIYFYDTAAAVDQTRVHGIDQISSWSAHTGRRHMTGTRRDCPLTRSLTDTVLFSFSSELQLQVVRPRPGSEPALGPAHCGSSADLLPARWTCWGCGSHRWPNPAPRPCWSAAASLFPSTPSAGVSSSTVGYFRVRLCACAPSFRVSAGKWRQKQRFLHPKHDFYRQPVKQLLSERLKRLRTVTENLQVEEIRWKCHPTAILPASYINMSRFKRHNSHY